MAQRPKLPKSLKAERRGAVAILTLARPEKRNALNDATVLGLETFFATLPAAVKAVVLNAEGRHFSAGLDLSELKVLSTEEGIAHSRMWHGIFDKIEFGRVPVVTVMHGAVVGGGLELAAATHIRIAERSAYYALPEGSRGIFVGGGGSVRLPRIIGVSRMMDLMLTGRTYGAEEGQAFGISHYLVGEGEGLAKGHRDRQAHRRQFPDHEFRYPQRAAAHRRAGSRQRLRDGVADRGDRAGQRGSQEAHQGFPRETRREGGTEVGNARGEPAASSH